MRHLQFKLLLFLSAFIIPPYFCLDVQNISKRENHLFKIFENSTFTYFHYYSSLKDVVPVGHSKSKPKSNSSEIKFQYFDFLNKQIETVVSQMQHVFPKKYFLTIIQNRGKVSEWTQHPISVLRSRFSHGAIHLVEDLNVLYRQKTTMSQLSRFQFGSSGERKNGFQYTFSNFT